MIVSGDETLAAAVAALLPTFGCDVVRATDVHGANGGYDGAVICAALPSLLGGSGVGLQLNADSLKGLRFLYFANQAACKCLRGPGCALVDVVASDGGTFWKREIDGLTQGVANAMVTSRMSVNTIHLLCGEPKLTDGRATAVAGLGDLIALWLSDAGAMSTGNVFDVDCEAISR